MYKKLNDPEWLCEEYVNKTRTQVSIAEEIGCSKQTVSRVLKKHAIQRRSHTSRYPMLNNKEWLAKAYIEDKRTIKDIASELGTTAGNVHSHLTALGIKTRGVKETYNMLNPVKPTGKGAANWRGGKRIINGYVYIYAPDHPASGRNNVVQEHRLVMEDILGRYLEPWEVVHHLDGDRQNNDPSNLIVKERGRHVSEHFKASHEVLELRRKVEELEQTIHQLNERIAELEQKPNR